MNTLCIDARMIHSSGIGTYLQNLLPYLDSHYKLFLLGNMEELRKLSLVNHEIIPVSSPIYSIKELIELPIKVPRCDIFWSPHYNAPVLPVKAKKRVTTIHDIFHLKFANTLSLSQKIYAEIIFTNAVKRSDQIITVSHFSKKELLSYFNVSEQKIHVIHNGVNNRFKPVENANEKKEMFLKYHLPEKFILFLGNVKPHKNISTLLKAFSKLKKEPAFQVYKLVIAGKRKGFITGMQDLDQKLHELNISSEVVFLESVQNEELPILFTLSDLLVFPSFYEGFGLPPLEAMACGCPTVVSDIECLREIYADSSLYVNPSDPESIKNGIADVLSNKVLRNQLIARGKEYAKNFTWKRSYNEHLHIFEKTLYNS